MSDSFDRILVIATRQIGDVLLTTPLIRAAKQCWPQARIDVLGLPNTLDLLRGNPDVAALIEAPHRAGPGATLRFLRTLWRRYDLALVTQHSDRAHLYGFVAARVRVGLLPEHAGHAWWKRALLRHEVTVAGDRGAVHTVSEKLALLDPWRGAGAPPVVDLVAPAAQPLPPDIEAALGPAPLVIHVPSMWRYKQWPLSHYRALVQALLAQGRQIVLSGGPAAADRAMVAEVATLAPPPQLIDASGRLSFAQLTTLLQRAALYIGPDTSVTHLAAACGTPLVALFGPSNPLRWAPWPAGMEAAQPFVRRRPEQIVAHLTLLQGEARCAPGVPCGRAGCEDHTGSRSDCLEQGLPVERVLTAVRARLAASDAARAAPALEASRPA
ncbi:MAG: glycosyltransferase family 9 protein [Burkholderiaceae bacterium]